MTGRNGAPSLTEFYPSFKIFTNCDSGGLDLAAGIGRGKPGEENLYWWLVADMRKAKEVSRIGPENIIACRPLGNNLTTARAVANYLEAPLASNDLFSAMDACLLKRGLSTEWIDGPTICGIIDDVVPQITRRRIQEFAIAKRKLDGVAVSPWHIEESKLAHALDMRIPKPKKYEDLKQAFEGFLEIEKEITRSLRSYLRNFQRAKKLKEFKNAKPLWEEQDVLESIRDPDAGWINEHLAELRKTFKNISEQYGYLDNLSKGFIRQNRPPQKRMVIKGGDVTETSSFIAQEMLRNLPANAREAYRDVQKTMTQGIEEIDQTLLGIENARHFSKINDRINILADPDLKHKIVEALHGCKAQLQQLQRKMDADYPDLHADRKR